MDRTGSARRWWTVASLFGLIGAITLANGGPFTMPGGPLEGIEFLPCPHGVPGARARPANSHQLKCSCGLRCGASWCLVRGCTAIALGRLDGSWICGVPHRRYARRCPDPDCRRLGEENAAARAYVCRNGHHFRANVRQRCEQCHSGYRVAGATVRACEACDWPDPPARR